MSAPSPRPSAFLGIVDNLPGKLYVSFCPFAVNVVENNGFPKAWRLCQADIARNHALEDLRSKESAHSAGYLLGKRGSLAVHGQKNTHDCKVRIHSPPDAHQRIKAFGDDLRVQ